MKQPFVSRILVRLAKRAGVRVHLEPEWGFVGQIVLPNGRLRYFRNTNFDLNPLGASEVAKDKDYANYFMAQLGYPTVPGKAFYADEWCRVVHSRRDVGAAYRYAHRLGFPVIVKPNSRSQGVGVSKVYTQREFYRAARFIFKKDNVMLVQPALLGRDYRVVVLDNEVISAYERLPLAVVGNSRSTIAQLLAALQREFKRTGRDTVIKKDDFRIAVRLRRSGLSLQSVPRRGERAVLLDNANLSTGGQAVDVTKDIHPAFKRIAVSLTRDMGLRYCGVDLLVKGNIGEKPGTYWVLEVNAAAGLDHYAASGRKQRRIVEAMYLKVLKAMKRL